MKIIYIFFYNLCIFNQEKNLFKLKKFIKKKNKLNKKKTTLSQIDFSYYSHYETFSFQV